MAESVYKVIELVGTSRPLPPIPPVLGHGFGRTGRATCMKPIR
jgi:hypothetical protein